MASSEMTTGASPQGALTTRRFTSKQMGDACEMLIAAELTLAGIPALKVPDNWPHYDVIAQPADRPAQRISVKSRTWKRGAAFVEYNYYDQFDWLAIVLLSPEGSHIRTTYPYLGVMQTWLPAKISQPPKPHGCDTSVSMRLKGCLRGTGTISISGRLL